MAVIFFYDRFFQPIERLERELHDLLTPSIADGIRVIPPPYGADSAWYGAKLISNVSYISLWFII
ncbi:putative Actin family [Helianthus anomalus]